VTTLTTFELRYLPLSAMGVVIFKVGSAKSGVPCNPGNRIPENTRHFQGSVISYADGHTKFLQHSQIWAKAHELIGLDQLTQFTLR